MIYLTPATETHIEQMLGRIRQADIDEFAAGYSLTPEAGMRTGIKVSSHCWAGMWRNRPIAIAGMHAASMVGDHAHPWMVATRDIERPEVLRPFLEVSRGVVRYMASIYPVMDNWVDARNRKAIRWLKWLGFEMGEPEPFGPQGLPFRHFIWRTDV